MRVAVIHGGTSSEHDVSVASGEGVMDGLSRAGHEVVPVLVDRAGEWRTPAGAGRLVAVDTLLGCDVAVPALHGVFGEDGTVQGFLEVLGVPHVGSPVAASAACLDKQLTKLVAGSAGIPVAPGQLVVAHRALAATRSAVELDQLAADLVASGLAGPVFVKPVHGGSSIGVTRLPVLAPRELGAALVTALAAGGDSVLVEAEVSGPEVDVPVLELPDGEVRCGPSLLIRSDPDEPFFTETAKYESAATRFAVPAPLAPELTAHLERLAVAAYGALGCRGLARVDFLVGVDGPVLNEVNTFPGFTPASQFPRMWAAAGVAYPDLVDLLVRTAAESSVATPAGVHR
ncbi:D-alanine--D-alanine ligase family protein [Terrabacter sp. 2RAF25]|uniref:D-alanine--D-alanine ligase family protein n=1 Tax=Terrabacter sp. 2RAF25 TaxID=3232998 RepID=UPI003F9E3484